MDSLDHDTYITVKISGDSEIQKLNKKYLGKDNTPDVLSFPMNENGYLGDIIVNRDQALRQAKEYGNDLEHEIAELVEHGVLHLLGVDHN